MPSIEIVAIAQQCPSKVDDLPFAAMADFTLKSHRSQSRFQGDFDRLSGIMYHLGNPGLKTDHAGRRFFAYQLLSPASRKVESSFLEFAAEYRAAAQMFFEELLHNSPVGKLVFTSDWQFGPEWIKYEPELSLSEFWRLHDSHLIQLNAFYSIIGS